MLRTSTRLLGLTAIALTLVACSGESATDVASAAKAKATETATIAKDTASKAQGSGTEAADSMKDKMAKPGQKHALLQGTLSGRNDHVTTGKVVIVKTPEGYALHLGPNFSLDGAPDPIVALGNNGTYDPANKLGVLKSITGKQSYAIPATMNPADFSEAYIWCEKFNVSLGTAALASTGYGSK